MWRKRVMWMQGRKEGFSVVEMMVVVAIIGALSVMAFSAYRSTTAKARQAEAKVNLKQIGDLMDVRQYEKGKYEDKLGVVGAGGNCSSNALKNELGYRPKDCTKLRYKYDITSIGVGTFTSEAENDPDAPNYGYIWPGCTTNDLWRGNEKGKIWQPTDAKNVLKQCGL